jgi:hypothetical protein
LTPVLSGSGVYLLSGVIIFLSEFACLAGMGMSAVVPKETHLRKLGIASVFLIAVGVVLNLLVGKLSISGEMSITLGHIMFLTFLQGVVIYFKHNNLALSIQRFMLFVLVSNVFVVFSLPYLQKVQIVSTLGWGIIFAIICFCSLVICLWLFEIVKRILQLVQKESQGLGSVLPNPEGDYRSC